MSIKKYKVLLAYHLRGFWRRIPLGLPFILFFISLFLFLLVLIPNFAYRFPIIGDWPRKLELCGTVLVKESNACHNSAIAAMEATIEIGGYKSTTNEEGKFQISFLSKSCDDIPIIIQWQGNIAIERVSFEVNQFKKTETFILNEW
jgi:hypothetical protein